MILLIDIGNSRTTIGLNDKDVREVSSMRTLPISRDAEAYYLLLKGLPVGRRGRRPEGAIICSVVPDVTPAVVKSVRGVFRIKPLVVHHRLKTGLNIKMEEPGKLGADRIATAVGARHLYGGDLIIIDFGTATTFCFVSAKGEYRNGAIMPGVGTSAAVLSEKTSQLPLVRPGPPSTIMGGKTEDNILTGIVLGHAGAVERIVKEMKKETRSGVRIVATGGYADLVSPYISKVRHVNRLLTLEGLNIIYGLNSYRTE